jgi:L-lysine 2,3-aminomutase
VQISDTGTENIKVSPKSRRIDPLTDDWLWQLKNSINTLEGVEEFLDVRFEPAERLLLERTLEKFPLSVTPY